MTRGAKLNKTVAANDYDEMGPTDLADDLARLQREAMAYLAAALSARGYTAIVQNIRQARSTLGLLGLMLGALEQPGAKN